MPESAAGEHSNVNPKQVEKSPHRQVRLIFFHGSITEKPAAAKSEISKNHHISAKLIRVKHKTLSDWIQKNDFAKIPSIAWAAAEDWKKNGEAEVTCNLTATNTAGSSNKIQNIVEVTYPTEWETGSRIPGTDGNPSRLEFSQATAWETRNVGVTLQSEVISDPNGPLLKIQLERVIEGGKSVHHRILRDGKWKPDITFPIFTANKWKSELRMKRGEWMLAFSGSDIDENGKLDSFHSVLAFIKVE
jgi:hypothetical protein